MSYSTLNNTEGGISPCSVNEFAERHDINIAGNNNYIENLSYSFLRWAYISYIEINISFEMSDEVDEFIFGEMEGLENEKNLCDLCCENLGDIKSDCCNCNSYCLECIMRVIKDDKKRKRQPCCVYCRQQLKKITSNDGNHIYNLYDWASKGYPLGFTVTQK
jgi:hypothetical protein